MSVRYTEGFDSYASNYSALPSTGGFRTLSGTATGFSISLANSRWNDGVDTNPGRGLVCTTSTGSPVDPAGANGVLGFALSDVFAAEYITHIRFSYKTPSSATRGYLCSLLNTSGSQQWGLEISALGYLIVQAANGAALATASTPIGTATWVTIDISVRTVTGMQVCDVKVDGTTVISITSGMSTAAWSDFALGVCRSGGSNYGNASGGAAFDDLQIVVADGIADPNGDLVDALPTDLSRVETFYPTSLDGASVGFTSVGGTTVADRLGQGANDGDTTYYTATNVGDKLILDSTGQLSINPANIYWVETSFIGRKDGVGIRSASPIIVVGGNEYDGAAQNQTTTYGAYSAYWRDNPDTGNAWTKATVEAALFGERVIV